MAGAPFVRGVPGTAGIARWRGGVMEAVGTGMNAQGHALAVFDDGDGPTPAALYAVGTFTSAGGNPSFGIARWSGCRSACPADLNDDGTVNGADLGSILGVWGACAVEVSR